MKEALRTHTCGVRLGCLSKMMILKSIESDGTTLGVLIESKHPAFTITPSCLVKETPR